MSHDQAIPLLDIYPKELLAETQTAICIPMSTAALFTKVEITQGHQRDECIYYIV